VYKLQAILTVLGLALANIAFAGHLDGTTVDQRTAPTGKVLQQGDAPIVEKVVSTIESQPETQPQASAEVEVVEQPPAKEAVETAAATEASSFRGGEEIYSAKCAMCHDAGIAGSPKVGDAAAWTARIAKGEAVLIENATKGFQGDAGMMPPKGGCFDCADEEISAAVEFMVAKSQ